VSEHTVGEAIAAIASAMEDGVEAAMIRYIVTYARGGLELFPADAQSKNPHVSWKLASRKDVALTRWWEQWPDALIGCRVDEGIIVADVDPRHGGDKVWFALIDEYGPIEIGRRHYSGRDDGGFHVWFERPVGKLSTKRLTAWAKERNLGARVLDAAGNDTGRWTCGIDLLTHDLRYTILPPSLHPATGLPYRWAETGEPTAMPPWLIELLRPLGGKAEEDGEHHDDVVGATTSIALRDFEHSDSIADWMTAHLSWSELLAPRGWTLVHGDGEGDGSMWRHPSATNDHSASIQHGCLFVFSPGTAFEPTEDGSPNGYTKFRAWAVLEHGGDLKVAASAARKLANGTRPSAPPKPPPEPISLDECHATFRRWFGELYDIDMVNVAMAATAAEHLDGDPLWLLIVSGSGNAKTETAQALTGAGAEVTSTIASEGALLSATPRKDKKPGATGGLLRRLGERGTLVIKDFTSILSMDRNTRGGVLAALREIHDGFWERNVGTDGGRSLTWSGRIVVVGAVTTAWDSHQSVVSMMGDRFVLLRADSTRGRIEAGHRSIANTGDEVQMRNELAAAVAGVIAGGSFEVPYTLSESEIDRLLSAADLLTMARTAVEFDYHGEVIDAHAPEMPTRFAKGLTQIVRGGVAIGMEPADAIALALRCARDSMPPLRLAILEDLAAHPSSTPTDVRRRLGKPRNTVRRQIEALHLLGLLVCREVEPTETGVGGRKWLYELAEGIDPGVLTEVGPCPDV
jgi:hypothetical protein